MEGPVYHVGRFVANTPERIRVWLAIFIPPVYQSIGRTDLSKSHKYRKNRYIKISKRSTNIQKFKEKQDRSLSENKLEKLFFP